jgi:hypothetical protein
MAKLAGAPFTMIGGTYALRLLLPQKALRLELLFLSAALVLILGIVSTVNGSTNFKGSDPIEWRALFTFIAIAVLCGGIGYFRKKQKKWK